MKIEDWPSVQKKDFTVQKVLERMREKKAANRLSREILKWGEKHLPSFREEFAAAGRIGRHRDPGKFITRHLQSLPQEEAIALATSPAGKHLARMIEAEQIKRRASDIMIRDGVQPVGLVQDAALENSYFLPKSWNKLPEGLYLPNPFSKWRMAEMKQQADLAWSGRHMAKPGQTVIPAASSAEQVVTKPSEEFLFRGNKPQVVLNRRGEGSTAVYSSRHPDVAAGYAAGNAGGIYGKSIRTCMRTHALKQKLSESNQPTFLRQ